LNFTHLPLLTFPLRRTLSRDTSHPIKNARKAANIPRAFPLSPVGNRSYKSHGLRVATQGRI
jgi:hypothetical protein